LRGMASSRAMGSLPHSSAVSFWATDTKDDQF
jgi:hypothetical protein